MMTNNNAIRNRDKRLIDTDFKENINAIKGAKI